MQQMQFKDRLCRTLLRINWLIAIAAILPVLSKIFIGVAAIDMHPKSWTLLEVHIFYVKEEKNQQKV